MCFQALHGVVLEVSHALGRQSRGFQANGHQFLDVTLAAGKLVCRGFREGTGFKPLHPGRDQIFTYDIQPGEPRRRDLHCLRYRVAQPARYLHTALLELDEQLFVTLSLVHGICR